MAVDHPALALVAALGIGLASFAMLEAWTGVLFDGTARSIIGPLLLVGTTAAAAAAWVTHRWGPAWWAGSLTAGLVWLVWWQVLLWQSLQEHGSPIAG